MAVSETILSAVERGLECPSCGVPFDQHDGIATMCRKLNPPPGDPRLLKTMAETIVAGITKKNDQNGCEYSVIGKYRAGLMEPYELAQAYLSTPSWQDRPTGPGLWYVPWMRGLPLQMVRQEHLPSWDGESDGRVYGPIPEDVQQEGTDGK